MIGSNPPSVTSGDRTRAGVELARVLLEFEAVHLVNIFARSSYRSGGLSELGGSPDGWLAARPAMDAGLGMASGVLLAYGVQTPSGAARRFFDEQVRWLEGRIQERGIPTWWVGGAPRHPSRWQRHTFRTYPGKRYREALAISLERRS